MHEWLRASCQMKRAPLAEPARGGSGLRSWSPGREALVPHPPPQKASARQRNGPSQICAKNDRYIPVVRRQLRAHWVQACARVRHHWPSWHINGRPLASVPQAHVPVTCSPSAHIGIAFFCGIAFFWTCFVTVALWLCACFVLAWCTCFVPFAWATPTQMAVASNAIKKVFSIVSASMSGCASALGRTAHCFRTSEATRDSTFS
jgi:hypothetical protein